MRAAKVTLEPGGALVKMDEEIADEVVIAAIEAEGFTACVRDHENSH